MHSNNGLSPELTGATPDDATRATEQRYKRSTRLVKPGMRPSTVALPSLLRTER